MHRIQSNIFKITIFKLQIIRLAQGHYGVVRQLTKTAIFIATPRKKTYLAVHLPKGIFCQFIDRKVIGLVLKY